jgi:hypothetical protein
MVRRWRVAAWLWAALLTWLMAVGSSAGASVLPDGRAYEQVSPTEKHGYPVKRRDVSVSPDGERISYSVDYPIGDAASGALPGLLGMRSSSEWVTKEWTTAPHEDQIGEGIGSLDTVLRGTTPDETAAVYWDNTTRPEPSLWLVRPDGSRTLIVSASTRGSGYFTPYPIEPGQPYFEGMSRDGRHVVFADTDLLEGAAPTNDASCHEDVFLVGSVDACEILYEWVDDGTHGGAGSRYVVGWTQGGNTELGGASRHLQGWSSLNDRGTYGYRHAISADGARIFFQGPAGTVPSPVPYGAGPVFLHQDGSATVEISAPDPASGYVPQNAPTLFQYLDASVDGRHAFFWANGDLAPGAPLSGGIYRYDADAARLEFLTATSGSAPPTALASDDGSVLYYQGSDGGIGRYANGQARLISPLQASGNSAPGGAGFPQPGLHADMCPSANVSHDGRFLVFRAMDSASVTQVFRYDAQSDTLLNISQSPADAGFFGAGGCYDAAPSQSRQFDTRIMSDDASFVFFDTDAALVPEDINGVRDVYEWHDGRVALISNGTGVEGADLLGASETGNDVFFISSDSLVPQDKDYAADIYDARVGGGFPLPSPAASCQGELCQGITSEAAPQLGAASEDISSSGNVHRARCGSFAVGRFSARERFLAVRTGRMTVHVRTCAAGLVRATLSVRLNGRWIRVDRARRSAARAESMRLVVRLSSKARKVLHQTGALRARIDVRYSRARLPRHLIVVLRIASVARQGGR